MGRRALKTDDIDKLQEDESFDDKSTLRVGQAAESLRHFSGSRYGHFQFDSTGLPIFNKFPQRRFAQPD